MSLFTSLYPSQHRVNYRFDLAGGRGPHTTYSRALDRETATLPELLALAGYRTEGYSSPGTMTAALGFSRGFSEYREIWPPFAEKIDRLIDDMAHWDDTPRFVFLHTFEAHAPYTHAKYASYLADHELQSIRATATHGQSLLRDTLAGLGRLDVAVTSDLYDGGIRYVDEHLGRLLDSLRRTRRTTVVFLTSDHGDEFADHSPERFYDEHGHSLFQELLHVPLIAWSPGRFQPGQVVADPVQLIDVAPTILSVIRAEIPEAMEGVPLIDDRGVGHSGPSRPIVAEALNKGSERILFRRKSRKYVSDPHGGADVVFDLDTDPRERRGAKPKGTELSLLREELVRYVADNHAGALMLAFGRGCYAVEGSVRASAPIIAVDPADVLDHILTPIEAAELRIAFEASPSRGRFLLLHCRDPDCGFAIDIRLDGVSPTPEQVSLGGQRIDPRLPEITVSDVEVPGDDLGDWIFDGRRLLVTRIAAKVDDRPRSDPGLVQDFEEALVALGYVDRSVAAHRNPDSAGAASSEAPVRPGILSLAIDGESAGAPALVDSNRTWCSDFDGDGKLDRLIVDRDSGNALVAWGSASSHSDPVPWPGDWPGASGSIESWDVNGDGKGDVLIRAFGEDRFGCEWLLFGGSRFHALPCNRAPHVVVFDGDFDGDGREDVLIVDQTALEYRVSLGSSEEPAEERVWLGGLGRGVNTRIGDFDEDGRDDVRIESGDGCLLLRSTGQNFEPNPEACSR